MEVNIEPTKKQDEAWKALETHNTVYMGGGAGGGKSWLICETRLYNCYVYPGYKSFIARLELKRLMQSTYLTWVKVCKFHNIPLNDWGLNQKWSYIEFLNGSRIDLLDVSYKTSDPLYERLGSLEYTDGAIEEAGEIHYMAYDVLKSRISRHNNFPGNENGEYLRPTLLITGNPKKNWTYTEFYRPWKEGKLSEGTAFIQALYNDNPYTSEAYGKQLDTITDRNLKERLKYGNWDYDDDPAALCDYDAITDIFTNSHVIPSSQRYISADLAMQGRDRFVAGHWEGLIGYIDIDLEKTTGKEIEQKIKELKVEKAVPNSHIAADSDGIGAYLESYIDHIKTFHGGSRAFNSEYANLKSECGFKLAELINNRNIWIRCRKDQEERIKEEISVCLKRGKVDSDEQKKRLIPKNLMKEKLGRSPDYLDYLLIRMYFEVEVSRAQIIF